MHSFTFSPLISLVAHVLPSLSFSCSFSIYRLHSIYILRFLRIVWLPIAQGSCYGVMCGIEILLSVYTMTHAIHLKQIANLLGRNAEIILNNYGNARRKTFHEMACIFVSIWKCISIQAIIRGRALCNSINFAIYSVIVNVFITEPMEIESLFSSNVNVNSGNDTQFCH